MTTTRLDTELMSSKQFEKYAKHAGDKNAKELIQQPKEKMEKDLVECELYMAQVKSQTAALPAFQKAQEQVKDIKAGERDTLKPYRAKHALLVAALRSLKENP